LTILGSAAQEQDDTVSVLAVVDAITRTIIDPHFTEAASHRLDVSRVSKRQTVDTKGNFGFCALVA
jgi:hypothetical protein